MPGTATMRKGMEPGIGFEPMTDRLQNDCSTELSYPGLIEVARPMPDMAVEVVSANLVTRLQPGRAFRRHHAAYQSAFELEQVMPLLVMMEWLSIQRATPTNP